MLYPLYRLQNNALCCSHDLCETRSSDDTDRSGAVLLVVNMSYLMRSRARTIGTQTCFSSTLYSKKIHFMPSEMNKFLLVLRRLNPLIGAPARPAACLDFKRARFLPRPSGGLGNERKR